MKQALLLSAFLAIMTTATGQATIDSMITETLAKTEKTMRHWNGENETVVFAAIRRKTNKVTDTFFQISLASKEFEQAARTRGVAIGMDGTWAVGQSKVQNVNMKQGNIELTAQDFFALKAQMNKFYLYTLPSANPEPKFDTRWDFTLAGRMTHSLIYKSDTFPDKKWTYGFSLDGAEFTIPSDDALILMRKISAFSPHFE